MNNRQKQRRQNKDFSRVQGGSSMTTGEQTINLLDNPSTSWATGSGTVYTHIWAGGCTVYVPKNDNTLVSVHILKATDNHVEVFSNRRLCCFLNLAFRAVPLHGQRNNHVKYAPGLGEVSPEERTHASPADEGDDETTTTAIWSWSRDVNLSVLGHLRLCFTQQGQNKQDFLPFKYLSKHPMLLLFQWQRSIPGVRKRISATTGDLNAP